MSGVAAPRLGSLGCRLGSRLGLRLGLLLPLLALGCPDPIFHGSVMVSTKTNAVPPHEVLGTVSSDYCDHLALLVIPVLGDQREHVASLLQRAQAQGGDAVVDFQVRVEDSTFVFPLYMQWCWKLEGTVVRFAPPAPPAPPASDAGG